MSKKEKGAFYNFFVKYNKIIYYVICSVVPLTWWFASYQNYGGIEYYFPERREFTVHPNLNNIAIFFVFDEKPDDSGILNVINLFFSFCSKNDEFDSYNPNFYVFTPEEIKSIIQFQGYVHTYDNYENVVKDILDLKFLDEEHFQYAYFANPIGIRQRKNFHFCREVIGDTFLSIDEEDNPTFTMVGGKLKEFKKFAESLSENFSKKDLFGHNVINHINEYYSKDKPPQKTFRI